MVSVKKLVVQSVGRWLLSDLTVDAVESPGANFRLVTVTGLAPSRAGDKVQLVMDDGMRTYTPFDHDGARTRFLAHLRTGSTSERFRTLRPGDRFQAFGPRGSIALDSLTGRVIVVGDETSFALARSLTRVKVEAHGVFLVHEADAATVLSAIDAPVDAVLGADEVQGAVAAIAALTTPDTTLVLSGRGRTIQALRAALVAAGVTAPQRVKAYWADGKRGLD
jgi:NADPH-dependent ferric siderophore reductase